MHDFNPGITLNGVFWIVQVPDDAVQITGDSLTINLQNVAVVDQFQFPGGTGNVPVTLSYVATYTKSGMPRHVRPTSHDPLSPFNWAGKMWTATNSGTFSVAYNDGGFSAQGGFSSSGNFGEMGTERNGSFVGDDDDVKEAELLPLEQGQTSTEITQVSGNENAEARRNLPLLKGRVPVKGFTLGTAPAGNR